MLSTVDSAGPAEAEAKRLDDTRAAKDPDPMHPLWLPVLVAGAMQPLTEMCAMPCDDEPSETVSQLLLLLLMESFLVSLGDPFEGEPPVRRAAPGARPLIF
ncbi:MAG: hypothetical protein ABW220_13510 [Burkholderiaceae bacterium]